MTKEKRVNLSGDIIARSKIGDPAKAISPIKRTSDIVEPEGISEEPVTPEETGSAVDYDITIRCATSFPPGYDMEQVCDACPYSKTPCMDGILLPTETQLEDILRILTMDEGDDGT